MTKSAALNGMESAAEYLRAESANEVPRDTHALAQSAEVSSDSETVVLSYDTDYAIKQHEELGYRHPRGGKAKYLEDPFNANTGKMVQIVRQKMDRDLQ